MSTLNLVGADFGKLRRLQHRLPEALAELQAANDVLATTAKNSDMSRPLALSELALRQLAAGDVQRANKTAEDALNYARKAYTEKHYMLGVLCMRLLALDSRSTVRKRQRLYWSKRLPCAARRIRLSIPACSKPEWQ